MPLVGVLVWVEASFVAVEEASHPEAFEMDFVLLVVEPLKITISNTNEVHETVIYHYREKPKKGEIESSRLDHAPKEHKDQCHHCKDCCNGKEPIDAHPCAGCIRKVSVVRLVPF
jgi:hypothetical protein